jgi:anti-sigma B factor antagonist
MEISTTEYRHCYLIKASGRVDSATAPELAEALNAVQKSGHYKIVLDLSGVDYLSSSGLRVLINTQKNSRRYNRGELVLANVTPRVYSALDLAGFIPYFKLFDDITAAVGNF